MKIFIDPQAKTAIDRAAAVAAIDAWFAAQVAAGFTTPQGWKIGLSESDVTLLTGAFVLAKEADALGLPPPPIVDTDGQQHSLTLQELTSLMLAYGQARAALSSEYAARIAAGGAA